jgi:hypothetical protein
MIEMRETLDQLRRVEFGWLLPDWALRVLRHAPCLVLDMFLRLLFDSNSESGPPTANCA